MQYNYYISSDATCDLPKQLYEQEFTVLPMPFVLDGTSYADGNQISSHDFFEKLRNGSICQTSLVNTETAVEKLTPVMEEGFDVFHIAFSSVLSGSYSALLEARKILLEKFPDRKMYVVDSKCASLGEGLLVYYCLKQRREGMSFDNLVNYCEDLKNRVHHDFTVDSLMFLLRGGRVSKSSAILGTALQVKPLLITDTEGRLTPIGKVVGRKQSLKSLVDKMYEKSQDISNRELVLIGHGDCYDDACYVRELIKKRFGYTNIVIGDIGTTIGAHSGPGTVALFYIATDKEK